MQIHLTLRKLRLENKLKQENVATALSVSQSTVCDWETPDNKKTPNIQHLVELATLYKTTPEAILLDTSPDLRMSLMCLLKIAINRLELQTHIKKYLVFLVVKIEKWGGGLKTLKISTLNYSSLR